MLADPGRYKLPNTQVLDKAFAYVSGVSLFSVPKMKRPFLLQREQTQHPKYDGHDNVVCCLEWNSVRKGITIEKHRTNCQVPPILGLVDRSLLRHF